MQLGKYYHEVAAEATVEDIEYFLALRTIEAKERAREIQRANAKAKAKRGKR